jgi:hypothetical protein
MPKKVTKTATAFDPKPYNGEPASFNKPVDDGEPAEPMAIFQGSDGIFRSAAELEVTPPTIPEPFEELERLRADLAAYKDRERKVLRANMEVCRLHIAHLEAAEITKSAKKSWEAAAEGLQKLISRIGEKLPLFDRDEDDESSGASATATNDGSEDWRDVGIDILSTHGCSEATVNRLDKYEIATIGDLADWTAGTGRLTHTPKHLTDIPGIGAKAAEKIESALEGFWAVWPKTESKPAKEAEPCRA